MSKVSPHHVMLISHLSRLFADPNTADLTDVVLYDHDGCFHVAYDLHLEEYDEDADAVCETFIDMSFLPRDHLETIKLRIFEGDIAGEVPQT